MDKDVVPEVTIMTAKTVVTTWKDDLGQADNFTSSKKLPATSSTAEVDSDESEKISDPPTKKQRRDAYDFTSSVACSKVQNTQLKDIKCDYLYHFGLSSNDPLIEELFSDIRIVCMGGSSKRMEAFAKEAVTTLGLCVDIPVVNISKSDRYSLFKVRQIFICHPSFISPVFHFSFFILSRAFNTEFSHHIKVGPIISVNHGIGGPSISIVLHEVLTYLSFTSYSCHDVSKEIKNEYCIIDFMHSMFIISMYSRFKW